MSAVAPRSSTAQRVLVPAALARVLVIAGSDSGGGAGIQADIKAITACGAYAATALTAITAQDTRGVHAVHAVPPGVVRAQIECVLEDIGADAIKTGMLGDVATIAAVVASLDAFAAGVTLVVDPVMVAKGGASLLAPDAVAALRETLCRRATVLTPNLPEAAALTGRTIDGVGSMRAAADALLALGPRAVLLKGGHLDGPETVDLLVADDGTAVEWRGARLETRHTHGTGCTLASAVAAGLAQGLTLRRAVGRARDYVRAAIESAPGFGEGHGPLNHLVSVGDGADEGMPVGAVAPGAAGRGEDGRGEDGRGVLVDIPPPSH